MNESTVPAMYLALARWMQLAQALLEQPTAPLMEHLPIKFVREFAASRPNLKLTQDAGGNLRVDYAPAGVTRAPLVLVGHLDHPGFHVTKIDGAIVDLSFQGWVQIEHAVIGSRLHFERGNAQRIGEGELIETTQAEGRVKTAKAKLTSGMAAPDGFTMWAFPGFSVEDGLIVTRCCDDLLGSAVALCVLDEISRLAPANVALTALFTRAEEIGFLGALEAIRLNTLPKTACVLSLETSKAFANAPQGGGAIVRVGDKEAIFDPGLTHALTTAAKSRAERDTTFKWQRKLMDGGTCEATPFCAHGYRASGMALPLGNYHNQAFDAAGKPCIGPETVNCEDFRCQIELLVELAQRPELLDEGHEKIPANLQELAKTAEELLSRSAKYRI